MRQMVELDHHVAPAIMEEEAPIVSVWANNGGVGRGTIVLVEVDNEGVGGEPITAVEVEN